MKANNIRQAFLNFFAGKEHKIIPSFPLVPQNDKSLLLINAGMTPMKAYFTGIEKPPALRVATCQKCIRTIDIDDVGKDARHGSFFEMLGNFSFGDYFKKEAIALAWEFLIHIIKMDSNRLWISVYHDDNEAFDIWQNHVSKDRIVKLGKEDNFWEHGIGPCGPSSEIYFDRGEKYTCGKPTCAVGCDCDRFMEIWNLVFIQFEKQENGEYTNLAQKGIDTGMGLERMAMVLQEKESIFEIDINDYIPHKRNVSINIIIDHIKSVVFMASDGVLPSNEGRGYVLRRLLRRAIRHGNMLGLKNFVEDISNNIINEYSKAYPNLKEKSEHIIQLIILEEQRFNTTLDAGLNQLQRLMDDYKDTKTISGKDAFKLYDTFGFPYDLTREIAEEADFNIIESEFLTEMEAQKTRARLARGESTYMGADASIYDNLNINTIRCEELECESTILEILEINEHETAVLLDKTPFYYTSGGQKSDIGTIGIFEVKDCFKMGDNIIHICKGRPKKGDILKASINKTHRLKTASNHSATHLLHEALREVLGNHVEQAGSEVDANRLRFDFTHIKGLTQEEKQKIEELVNKRIQENLQVKTIITTPNEARQKGATALFGEKYGETVRMVTIGSSIELCGGTHVNNSKDIILFKLLSENGISAGVRRIEALTGNAALDFYKSSYETLTKVAEICKCETSNILQRLNTLIEENKSIKKELEAKQKDALDDYANDIYNKKEVYNNITIITAKIENIDQENLRLLSDKLRSKFQSGFMLLAAVNKDNVSFLAQATDDCVKLGIHCGQIVKEAASICGGGGGGRPNSAQAGGKLAHKADEAIEYVKDIIKNKL